MTSQGVRHAVDYFWGQAGLKEPFPRTLEMPTIWALPVAVVRLPRLCVAEVEEQLSRYGFLWNGPEPSLSLRGFMLATRGRGFLLINGSDPPAEQRYSLAHEVAHFLLDYHLPRLDAIDKMGIGIVDVLDGVREPTLYERVHASLAAAHIGTYEHISQPGLSLPDVEDRADTVAVELLAPADDVWRRCHPLVNGNSREVGAQLVQRLLSTDFGLPEFAAAATARLLVRRWWPQPTFQQWMGIKR